MTRSTPRLIHWCSQFKKDFKKADRQDRDMNLLQDVLEKLSRYIPLDAKFYDHELRGHWKGYRECHLNPDWLLIYKKIGDELNLARLGSHTELFD
jgi:mRNA interferase YafQ